MNNFITLLLLLVVALHNINSFVLPFNKLNIINNRPLLKLYSNNVIDIVSRNFDLTDAIKEKTNTKVGTVLEKLGTAAISTKVVLQVLKSTSETAKTANVHSAEVTVNFKGGATIHVDEQSDNMYSSIDMVSDKLNEAMRRRHEKLVEKKNRKDKSDGSILSPEEIDQLEALGDLISDDGDDVM